MASTGALTQGREPVMGRVLRSQSGFYVVWTDDGRELMAVLRGRIKKLETEVQTLRTGPFASPAQAALDEDSVL